MMRSSLAALSAFSALSVASPVNVNVPVKQTFTVDQVDAGQVQVLAPAISMLQTYKKFNPVGASAPPDVKIAAANAQSGRVQNMPMAYDQAYLSPVSVGGQMMNLNFDTGSADLWVYSTLQSSSVTAGHDVYNPDNSGTLMSGQSWRIQYGDGSGASGVVYADKVTVGGVTATSQAVEAATSVSSQFLNDHESDGLLGLSFSNINTVRPNQQRTFFDTVKSSLVLPVFTADLKRGAPGTYDFGFIDKSKYTGDITYVDVDSGSGFWKFAVDGYAVGAGSGAYVTSTYTAIADTGTTLLYIPASDVSAYYSKVNGAGYNSAQGGWIFPCSSFLPTYTAIIGGSKFTIPGVYINYARISNTMCFGGIQSNAGIGFSIYGDIFLKSQFVVFSMVNNRAQLGFAAQSQLTGVNDDEFEEWYYACDGSEVNQS